jgi:hypothetical protein
MDRLEFTAFETVEGEDDTAKLKRMEQWAADMQA